MYAAVECEGFGPVENLRVVHYESPPLGRGAIRLAVSACGVNFVDGLIVRGEYQIKPPVPFVPGMEVVGSVVEMADDVAALGDLSIGDRLFANVGFGGFASEVVVSRRQALRLPSTLTDGQAATFMQSYLTGWYALTQRIHVEAGDTMLVLGAGSGVGLAAVDIGAALGARVIAAASSPEKRELATERGALLTLDNSTLDATAIKDAAREFAATFEDRSNRGGVDVVYDPVGGEVGEVALRALGEGGDLLVIGFVAGIPKLSTNQILLRNRRVTGVDWGSWAGRNVEANRKLLADVLERVGAGALDPVEPTAYPLGDAATALGDLAARRVAGKVVLIPDA